MVFGKHSGSSSINNYLEKMGEELPEEKVNMILQEVKDMAYQKKTALNDDEMASIVAKYLG